MLAGLKRELKSAMQGLDWEALLANAAGAAELGLAQQAYEGQVAPVLALLGWAEQVGGGGRRRESVLFTCSLHARPHCNRCP